MGKNSEAVKIALDIDKRSEPSQFKSPLVVSHKQSKTENLRVKQGDTPKENKDLEKNKSAFIKWLRKLKKPTFKNKNSKALITDHSVISETLAHLLARQGKHEESIKMFDQLILLFPIKKTYFASEIDKIKKKL